MYTVQATPRSNKCIGCGGKVHEGGQKNCPAYRIACRRCGKIGHYSIVCRQSAPPMEHRPRRPTTPQTHSLTTLNDSELPFVQHTSSGSLTHAPTIMMNVSAYNSRAAINVLPDSVANICAADPHPCSSSQ